MDEMDASEIERRFEWLNSLSPADFESLVREWVLQNGDYDRVSDVSLRGGTGDFVAYRHDAPHQPVVYEVKRVRVAPAELVDQLLGMRERSARIGMHRFVAVLSGSLSERAKERAASSRLSVIDGVEILKSLPAELESQYSQRKTRLAGERKREKPKSRILAERLGATAPGDEQWAEYQELVRDLCDYLFRPPLGEPAYESSDAARRNRRDVILENQAEAGFWSLVCVAYQAHFVVVDAKNHRSGPVKKSVLELAHYLKPYGCGMFGLIFCRKEPGGAVEHAIREQWIAGNKMILTVPDGLVLQMLERKEKGEAPEDLLRRRLTAFRLSL